MEIDDLQELAFRIKPILGEHKLSLKKQEVLMSSILFEVANLLDELEGTCLHESVFPLLDEIREELNKPRILDFCVAFLEIETGSGILFRANILKSQLDNPEMLIENLELILELRDTSEIDKKIDVKERLNSLIEKRRGFKEIRFQLVQDMDTDKWQKLTLPVNKYGVFTQDIDGIYKCIHAVLDAKV